MKKFVLLNGFVEIDNQQFYLKLKNREVKERGGYVTIILGILLFGSISNLLSGHNILSSIKDYIHLIIQIIGGIVFLYLIYYMVFKKKWSKNNYINDIKKIEIDKDELETEVTIYFNNRREILLEFRNLENQMEPFLEELKKRNSRLEIKNI